jgi:hypothetical protein
MLSLALEVAALVAGRSSSAIVMDISFDCWERL